MHIGVRTRWALALLPCCLIGCDQVFDLERLEIGVCGDGDLLPEEDCDDGGLVAGDGCGPTCRIEPWFECRMSEPCLPVVGISRGPVTTMLETAGSTKTGNPVEYTCPDGEVVMGFEGYADQVGGNLGSLRVVCGSLGLSPSGDAVVTRATESELFGASPNGSLLTVMCADNEVATGFVPLTNTYVAGFQWICQPLSHTDGSLRFGTPRSLSFGLSVGTQETSRSCSAREVVSSLEGGTGTSIDMMGLGCSPISTVVCGDGTTTAPEMCDDGNLLRGDGCGRRCELE